MNISRHIAMESTERRTVYTPTIVICLMLANEQRITYYTLYIYICMYVCIYVCMYVYNIYIFVEEHFPLLKLALNKSKNCLLWLSANLLLLFTILCLEKVTVQPPTGSHQYLAASGA